MIGRVREYRRINHVHVATINRNPQTLTSLHSRLLGNSIVHCSATDSNLLRLSNQSGSSVATTTITMLVVVYQPFSIAYACPRLNPFATALAH